MYGKQFIVSKRYKVHDEKGEYKTGDKVVFVESRPLSRDKRWVVENVIKREIRTADTGVADLKVEVNEENEQQNEETEATNDSA